MQEELLDYVLGKSSPEQRAELERRFQEDPSLAGRLDDALPFEDSFLRWLREAIPAAADHEDSFLREALAKLQQSANALATLPPDDEGPPLASVDRNAATCQGLKETLQLDGKGALATVNDSPGPLERLGRYRILQTLGKGGMGAVYLAHDEELDRKVAVKIPFCGSAEVLERFKREARSAAALHHRNICPIFDVGEVQGQPYLTMAFVEGQTCGEWARTPRSQAEMLEVVRKVALALDEAHQAGIVHRDLKPANIMIDRHGEPVVMDFGLARREAMQDDQLTKTGQIMGTPAYMPPEQVAGRVADMGPASDVYALGMILYELLCGKRPFDGDLIALLSQIAMERPPSLRTHNSQIEPQLEALVLKALEKQPADRWGSMREFAQAIADYQAGGRQGLAEAPANGNAVERPKHDTPQLSNVLATIASSAAVPVADRRGTRKKASPPPTTSRGGRGRRPSGMVAIGGGGLAALLLLGVIVIKVTSKDGTVTELELPEGSKIEITQRAAAASVQPATAPASEPASPASQPRPGAWRAEAADDVLPGLIARPAKLPGIGRWQIRQVLFDHQLESIEASPDGRWIACGNARGEIWIYRADTFEPVHMIKAHPEHLDALSWSPDGEWLASGSRTDRSARLWQAGGWSAGPVLPVGSGVWCLTWSPDGKQLASGGDKMVRIWNVDGTAGRVQTGHAGGVRAVAWSSDGGQIASASADGEVRLWQAADGLLTRTLDGHTPDVQFCLSWSPDGKHLATSGGWFAGTDARARVWDIQTGGEKFSLQSARWVSWSSTGESIAVADAPKLRLVDAATGKELASVQVSQPGRGAWCCEGRAIVIFNGGETTTKIRKFQVDGDQLQPSSTPESVPLHEVAWSPEGRRMAVACHDGTLRLWEADGRPAEVLPGSAGTRCVAWSPDGTRLASGHGRTVHVWEADGTPERVLDGHIGSVRSIAWRPDGQGLASSDDKTVRLWTADGRLIATLEGHAHYVESIAWSPDGTYLASGSLDKSVRVWESDGALKTILEDDEVHCVAWSPDGKWVASGGRDRAVRRQTLGGTSGPILEHPGAVSSLAWSPDGLWLVSGGWRHVKLWRPDGTPGATLPSRTGGVRSVAWIPGSDQLTFGSSDGAVGKWSADGVPDWSLVCLPGGQSATFSAAGELLHGDLQTLENHIIYVIEREDDQWEVLKPSQFMQRIQP